MAWAPSVETIQRAQDELRLSVFDIRDALRDFEPQTAGFDRNREFLFWLKNQRRVPFRYIAAVATRWATIFAIT